MIELEAEALTQICGSRKDSCVDARSTLLQSYFCDRKGFDAHYNEAVSYLLDNCNIDSVEMAEKRIDRMTKFVDGWIFGEFDN